MKLNSSTILPVLAATFASMFFGASVVATKFVIDQTTPEVLAFLRYGIGALCLGPLLIWPRHCRIPWQDLGPIFILGIVFFGLFPWSFSAALQYIPATHGAIVLATMPILTLSLATLVGYEAVNRNKLLGVILTLFGVIIAIGGNAQFSLAQSWPGYLLMLATAAFGAVYNVFSRPYLKRHSSLHVTALSILAGVLFLSPNAVWQMQNSGWPEITATGWAAVVFIGTFAGAIGFYLWIWALERTTPTRVAVFVTLNPLAATALGALLLNEPITSAFTVGLLSVICGIVLSNRSVRPATIHSYIQREQLT